MKPEIWQTFILILDSQRLWDTPWKTSWARSWESFGVRTLTKFVFVTFSEMRLWSKHAEPCAGFTSTQRLWISTWKTFTSGRPWDSPTKKIVDHLDIPWQTRPTNNFWIVGIVFNGNFHGQNLGDKAHKEVFWLNFHGQNLGDKAHKEIFWLNFATVICWNETAAKIWANAGFGTTRRLWIVLGKWFCSSKWDSPTKIVVHSAGRDQTKDVGSFPVATLYETKPVLNKFKRSFFGWICCGDE